ncbi:MAG: sigma-70 family RNA polymerase sigma factor [Pirellulaceae bacterium]|nr:sigma-70 family RNA polymerase sigma factor [Pirellulaceae bacterium]
MTPKQFEELAAHWTRAQRTVAAFVRTIINDFHNSEEVLQRVAVTLVRKYEQYDPQRPFVAWAIGCARYEALAFMRELGNERLLFDNTLVEQIAETYEQSDRDQSPLSQFLDECVEELDGRSRQAIQLRYEGNLKTANIAREMNISDGAARMLLSRARTLLRKCVESRSQKWRDSQ